MKINLKQKKGITLIALVITVVVLLILAGVTIAMLTGDNGILGKATSAKAKSAEEEAREKVNLMLADWKMENTVNGISLNDFLTTDKYKTNRESQNVKKDVEPVGKNYIATVEVNGTEYEVTINAENENNPYVESVNKAGSRISTKVEAGYAFEGSSTTLKITATAPEGETITGITCKEIQTGTETGMNTKEASKEFTLNANGEYTFIITTNNSSIEVKRTINNILAKPQIEVNTIGNSAEIKVKNNYPSNANVKYKYTVGTETTNGIEQTSYKKEGLTIGNKYKVKVHAYIDNEENGADSDEQEIQISIEKPKISTECIGIDKIKVNVETEYSSDTNVMFEYYINDQKQGNKISKKEYTFENLNYGKDYKIKVKVYIGENYVESDEINAKITLDLIYKESARTYLFNKGDVCESLTGGWEQNITVGTASGPGETSITDTLNCKTSGYWFGYHLQTKNKIKISGFSKIIFVFTRISGTGTVNNQFPNASCIKLLGGKCEIVTNSEYFIKEIELKDMDDESVIDFGAFNGSSASVSQVFLVK